MPTYIVTGPDGKKYKVSGQGSKEDALAQVQRKVGAVPPAPAPVQSEPGPTVEARSGIFPFSRMSDGSVDYWDTDSGFIGDIKRGLKKAVGPIYGEGSPIDEQGRTSMQMIEGAAELAPFVTPVSPALSAGSRIIPGVANSLRQGKVAPPSADALRTAGAQGYTAARELGVQYNSKAVAGVAGTIRNGLEQDGILAELAPKTFKIIDKLSSPPDGSTAPLTGLIAARRALKNARMDFTNPTEKLAAERVIKQLDEFIKTPPQKAVVAGAASKAGNILDEANANYAAGKRSDLLTGKLDKADRQAAVANSGANIDNAIRQRANDVLNSEKLQKGFTKAELAMIRAVAEGSRGRNTLRYVGNLLGGGGGLGAVVSGGIGGTAATFAGGPLAGAVVGGGIPLTGMAAKAGGGALTRKAMLQADMATRSRSPLYQQMLLEAPLIAPSQAVPAAVLRGGMMSTPSALDMLFQREKN
jgi:hypothetical protein